MKWTIFVLVVCIFMIGKACSLEHPRNGIYLIPKGFSGYVIILFEQPDGVMPEIEGGRYVYKIPTDGILKIKNKGLVGIVNKSFYFVNTDGARQKIEVLRITGDRDPQGKPQSKYGSISSETYENTVFVMGAGGLGSFNTETKTIQFTSFVVSTPKQNDQEQFILQKNRKIASIHQEFLLQEQE